MSLKLLAFSRSHFDNKKSWAPISLGLILGLSGCSSFQVPDLIPTDFISKVSMPDLRIPANDSAFKRTLYAGGSVGGSSLKPDTSNTVFSPSGQSSGATQFRVGADIHNKLSLEFDTSVLGSVGLTSTGADQSAKDVSYSTAAVSALIYGLSSDSNRTLRQGLNPYGRIGYGLIQHGSVVLPLDDTKSNLLVGIGAEYGFAQGLAVRADLTRVDKDATFLGLGAVYRFGGAKGKSSGNFVRAKNRGVNAAANAMRQGNSDDNTLETIQSFAAKLWRSTGTELDVDGDGVANQSDECPETAENVTTNAKGCGIFDLVLEKVTFKAGSKWLTPRARAELDVVSKTMLAFPEVRMEVRAHTDNIGSEEANLELSDRRAAAVVTYLQKKGVRKIQLTPLGLGEMQPIDTNDTEEGRKANRRVELATLPNLPKQTLEDNEAILAAMRAHGVSDIVEKSHSKKVKASKPKKTKTALAQSKPTSVVPMVAAMKIEALPEPAKVDGLDVGGLLPDVSFEQGTAELTIESEEVLILLSEKLMMFPEAKLTVMGHTDNVLSEQESKVLSKQRAEMVMGRLVMFGVDENRLTAEGFGSSLPLAQSVTEADRKRNERIELRVIK